MVRFANSLTFLLHRPTQHLHRLLTQVLNLSRTDLVGLNCHFVLSLILFLSCVLCACVCVCACADMYMSCVHECHSAPVEARGQLSGLDSHPSQVTDLRPSVLHGKCFCPVRAITPAPPPVGLFCWSSEVPLAQQCYREELVELLEVICSLLPSRKDH